MEIESLFSSTRWEILKSLSQERKSPIELAEILKTTSANISQQLRLLELAGLIKSERTSNTEKGKPRIIYSISGDHAFMILATPNFTDKKLLPLTIYHKFVMGSLFLENISHHIIVSQVYLKIKDSLKGVTSISAGADGDGKDLVLYISAEKKAQESLKSLLADLKVRLVFQESRKQSAVMLYNSNTLGGGFND